MANKFIVALCVGGLMEMPELTYERFQVIEAENEKQAQQIYNERNKCNYFYGSTICEYSDDIAWLLSVKSINTSAINQMLRSKCTH